MPVRFRCPHCQSLLSVTTRRIGTLVPCPACRTEVLVPERDRLEQPSQASPSEPAGSSLPDSPPPSSAPSSYGAAASSAMPSQAAFGEVPATTRRPPAEYVSVGSGVEELPESVSSSEEEQPSFKLPKRRGDMEEMDLTPMVDVVFQLLIFFMVTASFSMQKSISAPTPEQNKKGVARSLQTPEDMQEVAVVVRIDNRNGVTVDDEPVGDLSDLPDVLRDRMRKEQKSEMVVFADGDAQHRAVVTVIDAANAVGMQRIRLSSSSPAE